MPNQNPVNIDTVAPFDFVLFGGTGDLAMRKLLPSMYYHHCDDLLAEQGRIIAVARSKLSREEYLAKAEEAARKHVDAGCFTEHKWQKFAERIHYIGIDVSSVTAYQPLADLLQGEKTRCRIFYLSTGPQLFAPICQNLAQNNLISEQSRLAVEKPLGRDLESSRKISNIIGSVFKERQIYRIDHYLGKEPVQNLLALRFGNALFEPLWMRGHVRDVQITVAETLGVEGRGEFYDRTGALRDMVQNHLLQLLCIIAMEAPTHNTADAVRDEKLKVLRSLRKLGGGDVYKNTVRGQYRSGAVDNNIVSAYADEEGVPAESHNETFVAMRVNIDNWRWAGVPFYLRTGKRLQNRVSEIVINFERLPHAIFGNGSAMDSPNQLVIRLQPEEYIRLSIRAKQPGPGMRLRPVDLNLNLTESITERQHSAYERIILDLLRGSQTLFLRHDELEAAWSWIDPVLEAWQNSDKAPAGYQAGTWGPAESSHLVFEDDSRWHEEN
ncbi:MAG: glucose-6-phosphate dehydrogenase [Gammaproteobacteria bacterium]|nr:glucose-6-phosphate dehydrogenase [Gammaproteobacteria bacterium]